MTAGLMTEYSLDDYLVDGDDVYIATYDWIEELSKYMNTFSKFDMKTGIAVWAQNYYFENAEESGNEQF